MPPLITRDEARALGAITEHAEIEALVQRAWEARQATFGDSTDMCSLVNAKSGGCAEDCGFCAQSRYAEAETPMHAMMEPEQILEHARAAEAAGAHRFCMVTQGQGLSKRDFEKVLDGARLVAEHTNLKRCASIGHMSVDRAKALKDAGIQRVHHNVETAESYYDEVSTTVRYEGAAAHDRRGPRGRSRDVRRRNPQPRRDRGAARRDGLRAGRDRPDVACRSTCSTRARARSSATASYMDPWEVVKWIAIFRLILPEALFRLCGGRVENLGELQPMAVKAGLNGVMMGNFLTTLGNTPDEDREMFDRPRPQRRAPARQRRPTRGPTTAAAGSTARRPTSSMRTSTPPTRPIAGGHRDPPVGSGDAAALRAQAGRCRRGPTEPRTAGPRPSRSRARMPHGL